MKRNKSNYSWWHALVLTSILGINGMFVSCERYLDIDEYIYDRTTIDSVFLSKVKLLEYINGAVACMPNEGNIYRYSHSPGGQAADEFFASWKDGSQAGMYLLLDDVTPESWMFADLWANMYKGIRKANIILERIHECEDLTDLERRDYMGRAYFLRAYFYYTLLRHYGPVPILPDTPYDTDESIANVSLERDTWDDCVNYICDNFEQAGNLLPAQRERAFEYVPTSGAAFSLIARLRLYQASTWYNGNSRYSTWTRSDGRPFISQEYDPDRWGIAAAAFKRVIDMGQYKLHTIERDEKTLPLPATVSDAPFPSGAGDIDPYLSYKRLFDGGIMSVLNPELIFYQPITDHGISIMLAPAVLGGYNGFNIPLDFAQSYNMADGRSYSEATMEEKSWQPIGSAYGFSGEYTVGANVAVRDAYREPRFYASIGYNHCIWPGTSYLGTLNVKNFEVTYYKDGSGAPKGVATDFNHTGYTSRKFFHQEDNYAEWNHRSKSKTAPLIRYAEILMGYVEAMNEMDGSYTDEVTGLTVSRNPQEIVTYFNMIRYRAGQPGISLSDAASKEHMVELIRHERKIEFAFEAHRYYDLRRWGIAQECIAAPIYGNNINARTNERELFYTPILLDKEEIHRRTFNQKMYFYPIPKSVIERNRKLVQNPGWK